MANSFLYNKTLLRVGDRIKVDYKIVEKEKHAGKTKRSVKEEVKERIQPFEGVLIAIRGVAENKSITVRKNASDNIGVERVFPIVSPWIAAIKSVKKGRVRRAKLYYLRNA